MTEKIGVCFYCRRVDLMTDDHVIPRCLGGPDEPWNIVDACGSCNLSKGRLTYEEFTGETHLPLKSKYATTQIFLSCAPAEDRGDRSWNRLPERTLEKLKAARERREGPPGFVADLRGPPPKGGW